jgi:hypothetical protein
MKHHVSIFMAALLLASCSRQIVISGKLEKDPGIFPDYSGVCVPCNIAPLNFRLLDPSGSWKEKGVISARFRNSSGAGR